MDLNKKHLLYLIVFFLFLSLNAFGQSNNITGRILDQAFNFTFGNVHKEISNDKK